VEGISHVMSRIDAQYRLSMTYDRGCEMARHNEISERTGMRACFADPHSPWQRCINENTNGLLRQNLPKAEDLRTYSQEDMDRIASMLNIRPRKTLGWKIPAELFLPDFESWPACTGPCRLKPGKPTSRSRNRGKVGRTLLAFHFPTALPPQTTFKASSLHSEIETATP